MRAFLILFLGVGVILSSCGDHQGASVDAGMTDMGEHEDLNVLAPDVDRGPKVDEGTPPGSEIAPPEGECAQFVSPEGEVDSWRDNIPGSPTERVLLEDVIDVSRQSPGHTARRLSMVGVHMLNGAHTRQNADEDLVIQFQSMTGAGAQAYHSYFSVMVNLEPVEATYRVMSLDDTEVLFETFDTGLLHIGNEALISMDVTIPADALPRGRYVDLTILARHQFISSEYRANHLVGTPTNRMTLYNGGSAWPDDIDLSFGCPADSDYEPHFFSMRRAFAMARHFVYDRPRPAEEFREVVPVPSPSVQMWHSAGIESAFGGIEGTYNNTYAYQVFVNGRPQGDPTLVSAQASHLGFLFRQRVEVTLDPMRDFNSVLVANFLNPFMPVAGPFGRPIQPRSTHLWGTSNEYFMRVDPSVAK